MNAPIEVEAEPADWTVEQQVVRARNISNDLSDALIHLWILARGGEPSTDMEKLIRRQIDDAMADTTEIYAELKQTLEWLVQHEREASK